MNDSEENTDELHLPIVTQQQQVQHYLYSEVLVMVL